MSPVTRSLVVTVAAVGFLFDTYELLILPLIGGPAIAELLGVPPGNPLVAQWQGYIGWAAAVCGGVFGLLGGYLIDRFGRKTVMVGSILLYSLSPVAAAFSTSVWMFAAFRCTTFIGVCVEFVAAITWLAELFQEKRAKELAIGWTQAFASVGGLAVTGVNSLIVANAARLPAVPVPEPFDQHVFWRYTLLTGLVPGALILLLMPFVPESQSWAERKRAGTLRRPRFGELFAPALRRTTLVTTALSACAYAAAFGALQLTPSQVAPGLPQLAAQQGTLEPLRGEAAELNGKFNALRPKLEAKYQSVSGLADVVNARAVVARDVRQTQQRIAAATKDGGPPPAELAERLKDDRAQLTGLTARLGEVTAADPEAKQLVLDREATLRAIGDNREKQREPQERVSQVGNWAQTLQETGGLTGRIVLAVLLVLVASRRKLLRLFLLPGVIAFPLTYYYLYREQPDVFVYGVFVCGLCTVAQFSYFGEYLPKAYPLHLRGTGGSFATNVGGRMIGTAGGFVTTSVLAPFMPGDSTFHKVAVGAAVVGGAVYVIGIVLSFFLPEPKPEAAE